MHLRDLFVESLKQSETLIHLYDGLLTRNQRAAHRRWKERFYHCDLVSWAQRDGLWRSNGSNILVIGNDKSILNHNVFNTESLSVLLRMSLVSAMAAIDKLLHEAIMKRFAELVANKALDRIVTIDVSTCYRIAQQARERRGYGGRIKSRPAHKIKAEVLNSLFQESFLSRRRLEQICAACSQDSIFSKYSTEVTNTPEAASPQELQKRWAHLYHKRNQIAHECDIERKVTTRIHYNLMKPDQIKKDIHSIKAFGTFIANRLCP
jgi:hypothetical protein